MFLGMLSMFDGRVSMVHSKLSVFDGRSSMLLGKPSIFVGCSSMLPGKLSCLDAAARSSALDVFPQTNGGVDLETWGGILFEY